LERFPLSDDPACLSAAARIANAAFAQRRKTVRNSLRSTLGVETAVLDEALLSAGIDGSLRAEVLEPQCFLGLAAALEGQLNPSS